MIGELNCGSRCGLCRSCRRLCGSIGRLCGSGLVLIQRFVAAVIEDIRLLAGFAVFAKPSVALVDLEACRIRGDIRSVQIKGLGAVPVADVLLLGLSGRNHVGVA